MTFNFTSALMAGLYIVGELGGSSDISSYGVSFYGLGNICTFPLTNIIESRIGKIEALLIFLALFTVTLFLVAIAPGFPLFNFLRFLSGAAAGVLFPIASEFINALHKGAAEKKAFAFLAFFVSIIPVLGACFGGWIAYSYYWRLIFFLQIPFVCLTFLILYKARSFLTEPKTFVPFDKVGYILYLLALCPAGTAVIIGQEMDWQRSPLIVSLFTVSALSLIFFIRYELRHKTPFIDLRLFLIPVFSLSVFSVVFLFSAYFGMIMMLSLWLHLYANYSPLWIALLLSHMFIAAFILFLFIVKWMEKTNRFLPIILAVLSFAVSCYYSTYFNVDIDFGRLAIARIFSGFGLAFFLFPLLKICLESAPEDKKKEASYIFQSMRLFAGSLGVAAYMTMLQRRTVFYRERLGSSLTEFSDTTEQTLFDIGLFGQKGLAGKELLEGALTKQSTALALADCFYFMTWVMIILFLIILLYLAKEKITAYKAKLFGSR